MHSLIKLSLDMFSATYKVRNSINVSSNCKPFNVLITQASATDTFLECTNLMLRIAPFMKTVHIDVHHLCYVPGRGSLLFMKPSCNTLNICIRQPSGLKIPCDFIASSVDTVSSILSFATASEQIWPLKCSTRTTSSRTSSSMPSFSVKLMSSKSCDEQTTSLSFSSASF